MLPKEQKPSEIWGPCFSVFAGYTFKYWPSDLASLNFAAWLSLFNPFNQK